MAGYPDGADTRHDPPFRTDLTRASETVDALLESGAEPEGAGGVQGPAQGDVRRRDGGRAYAGRRVAHVAHGVLGRAGGASGVRILCRRRGDGLMKRLYVIEAVYRPPKSDGKHVIKIGVSAAVPKRLQAMQVGCPLRLRLLLAIDAGKDAHRLERTWHAQFDAHLIGGREWFAVGSPVLRSMLRAITVGQRPDPEDICDVDAAQISLARRRRYPDTVYCSKRCRLLIEQCRRMHVKIHHHRTLSMMAILREYGPPMRTESLEALQSLS